MPQSDYDSLPSVFAQLQACFQQSWEQEVLSRLPVDYEQQARQLGAFVRLRGLASVGDLLRGLLAYVVCACSLRSLGAWAVLVGVANLSHVAWLKRLRGARDWLLWLLIELLAVSPPAPGKVLACARIVLLDATRLKEPGGTGDDWRVHLGYDLLAGRLLDVRVSDQHTAEGFTLFGWQEGDLVVADRGYCRRGQLAWVLRSGAHVLVRLAVHQMPLLDAAGEPFNVVTWLKEQGPGPHGCRVAFEHEGRRFWVRLIVCALPEEAAERARAKQRKKAHKQQRQIKEETLLLCGWLLLLSSLSEDDWPDEQVLALYRARWQIELVIKRMKQLLKLAQLRGKTALTNEATILAVLLCWALVQPEIQQARLVLSQAIQAWAESLGEGPAGEPQQASSLPSISSWALTAVHVQTLRQLVQGHWTFARLRACLFELRRFLCSRRRRVHQESALRRRFLLHLAAWEPDSSLVFSCSSA